MGRFNLDRCEHHPRLRFATITTIDIWPVKQQQNGTGKYGSIPRYQPRGRFLSTQEIAAYNVLTEVFGADIGIFPKVALADLAAKFRPDEEQVAHWTKVQFRRIDFLVCEGPALEPILAIKIERRSKARDRDVLDDVLEDIGLPLLRLNAHRKYEKTDIIRKVNFAIQEAQGACTFSREESSAPGSEATGTNLDGPSHLFISSTLRFLSSIRDKYLLRAWRSPDSAR